MLVLKRSKERGQADHGWLQSFHTFSFAEYYDAAHMNFRSLRVINEDYIAAGQGFGTHPHRDMEIITYVVAGELEHKDSMGNGTVIRPGEVQYMCAGTGVRHSEFNPSSKTATHLLQIWIIPDRAGHPPRYDQKSFEANLQQGEPVLVVSPDGRSGSIAIHQDACIHAARMPQGKSWKHSLAPARHYWFQLIKGELSIGSQRLRAGDALSLSQEQQLEMIIHKDAEWLLFDLA